VLIIFVIMMLSLTREDVEQEKAWLQPKLWVGPALLSFVLLAELVYLLVIAEMPAAPAAASYVDARAVGLALYGPYVLGVQLSGILLMAGIVGAYHLGRQKKKVIHRFLQEKEPQKERSAVL
jgi:NADH-quinone oxidoreductase subunit J